MKKIAVFLMLLMVAGFAGTAMAEDVVGVAGCSAIQVNPDLSMEDQQSLCNAAEGDPSTSCAASGHGVCSSPKLNDTLPEAGHCICVQESTEEAPVGDAPVEEVPVE